MFISGKKENGKQEGTIVCIVTTINNRQPWDYRISNANFVRVLHAKFLLEMSWLSETYDAKLYTSGLRFGSVIISD